LDIHRQEQIRRALKVTLELVSQVLRLLDGQPAPQNAPAGPAGQSPPDATAAARPALLVDPATLSVNFCDRTCFLGNTLGFKVLLYLAQHPDAYVTYESLLSEVWQARRSDAAVRSVVKNLRGRLRQAGLGDLAALIDGTAAGHYGLKLARGKVLCRGVAAASPSPPLH
jgi:DNA-binding response OmpR family regulator